MVMTTQEAKNTLSALENLIAVLEDVDGGLDRAQRQVLYALRNRRRALRALLATRKLESSKKIIRLDLWREGYQLPPLPAQATA
jgi:hypothetical protein